MKMTLISLLVAVFCFPTFASINLDATTNLSSFGKVKFRAPKRGNNTGKSIVLIHGVYAGSTSITWKELLPLLDGAGVGVYVVDLPGIGLNGDTTKRTYSMEDFDQFLIEFLETVVKKPATVVAESLLTNTALQVAGDRPNLIEKLVLLSPSGINSLATALPAQAALFNQFWNNDQFAMGFYNSVFEAKNLEFFLKKTVFDDSLITPERIKETQQGGTPGQMWATLNFVGGNLTRAFIDSSQNVIQPTLLIFGEEAESSGTSDDLLEDPAEFLKIRPDFELAEIPLCGQSVHREKPEVTRDLILNFIFR